MRVKYISTVFMVFILTTFAMFTKAQETSLLISRVAQISSNTSVNVVETSVKNTLWLGTSNGLIKFRSDNQVVEKYFEGLDIVDLVVLGNNKVWAASKEGVHNYQTNQSIYLQKEGHIKAIEFWKGRVWIGTDSGLFALNVKTNKFEEFTTRNSKLKSNVVNDLKVDEAGLLWICTDAGEVRVKGKKWKAYHGKSKVEDVYENKEGLWFLAEGDMWLIDPFNREYNVGLDDSMYEGKVNDFVLDSKGRLYVASDKLIRYNPYDEQFIELTENAGGLSQLTTSLAVDRMDNIWVGTSGGLYQLKVIEGGNAPLTAAVVLYESLSCNKDASIIVNVVGGKSPYIYNWSHDKNVQFAGTEVGAGHYEVVVTDMDGKEVSAEIDVLEMEIMRLNNVEEIRPTSFGGDDGSLAVGVLGGKAPYEYAWSDGTIGNKRSGLKGGQYGLLVTDANGCKKDFVVDLEEGNKVEWLKKEDISIGKTILVSDLYFLADSTNVTPNSVVVMDEIYEFLSANLDIVIEIGGHTNTVPPHDYCDQLSTARAKSIADYLYGKGIEEDRLSYKGYGKRHPVTQDQSQVGRQKNQRVEIKILGM